MPGEEGSPQLRTEFQIQGGRRRQERARQGEIEREALKHEIHTMVVVSVLRTSVFPTRLATMCLWRGQGRPLVTTRFCGKANHLACLSHLVTSWEGLQCFRFARPSTAVDLFPNVYTLTPTHARVSQVRVCPQCARKLFRKKIEALRRQRKAEAQTKELESDADGDGERRRKRGKSSTPSPSGSARDLATPDGNAGDRHERNFRETSAGEGHDLIRQAVEAAGGTQTGAKKRNRPSRWGDRLESSERATAAAAGAGGGAIAGDDASRKAWAGELERDRTAEDEMDNYLSSLLL